MNTEQNYVGRGNYANTPPQTVKNGPKSPSTADNRPTQQSTCNTAKQDLYQAQTKLLELVDEYMSCSGASGPIEVINDLLYHWLTSPVTDLKLPANSLQLFRAFQLINFLAESQEKLQTIQYCVDHQQQEVSHD